MQQNDLQSEIKRNHYKWYEQVISKLLQKEECTLLEGLYITGVNVRKVKDTDYRLSFQLNTKIPAYISHDNGKTFFPGESATVYSTIKAISFMLRFDEQKFWIANHIQMHPSAIIPIFTGGTVDIIQQQVKKGKAFVYEFSLSPREIVIDHDTIINHIVRCSFNNTGQRFADIVAIKLLGYDVKEQLIEIEESDDSNGVSSTTPSLE